MNFKIHGIEIFSILATYDEPEHDISSVLFENYLSRCKGFFLAHGTL